MTVRGLRLKDELFKGNFTLFVGDFADVVAFMRERDFDPTGETPHLAKAIWLERGGCSEVVLWFRSSWNPRSADGLAVLAHEALHAVHFVLRSRGMSEATMLDEVANYYVEWLVASIIRAVSTKGAKHASHA
jgi:hypothetical protein